MKIIFETTENGLSIIDFDTTALSVKQIIEPVEVDKKRKTKPEDIIKNILVAISYDGQIHESKVWDEKYSGDVLSEMSSEKEKGKDSFNLDTWLDQSFDKFF